MQEEKTPILDRIFKRSPQVEEFIEKVRNNKKLTRKQKDFLIVSAIFLEEEKKNLAIIKGMQSQCDNLILEFKKQAKKISNEQCNEEKKKSSKKIGKKLIKGYDKLHNSIINKQ